MRQTIIFISLLALFASCDKPKESSTINDTPPQEVVDLGIDEELIIEDSSLLFPIVFLISDTSSAKYIDRAIERLNEVYEGADMEFEHLATSIQEFPTIGELTDDSYYQYFELSKELDIDNVIHIWVVPGGNPCDAYGCSLTNGFSMVNGEESNIVIADLVFANTDVTAHEIGHWFGLSHTFKPGGDNIEDTPEDPGPGYGAVINYEDCTLDINGYRPMVNNIMSYFPPCIDKRRELTSGQLELVRGVAWSYKLRYAFSAKDFTSLSNEQE